MPPGEASCGVRNHNHSRASPPRATSRSGYNGRELRSDVDGIVRFLCEERAFSEARVTAALKRAFPPEFGVEPPLPGLSGA